MGTESKYYKNIIEKLNTLTKKEYVLIILLGLQIVLISALSIFTTFSIMEALGNFSSSIRTVLFFLLLAITIAALGMLVIYPLLKYLNLLGRINYYEKAGVVGNYFPAVKDDLLNAMQLVSIDKNRSLYSPLLIDEAFKNVYNRTENLNFSSIVNFKKAKEILLYLSGIVLLCLLMFLFIPGLSEASGRLIAFNEEFIPPAKFRFDVSPGNKEITKGENVTIRIKTTGQKPSQVFLALKDDEQTDFNEHQLTPDSAGYFAYSINSVRSSFRYFAFSGDIKSEEFHVRVIERPVIRTLDITVTSPSYSKIPQHKQKDNGNITALKGSIIDIDLSSTKEISKAILVFGDTLEVPLKINAMNAGGKFTIKYDDRYKIIIEDENHNRNSDPIVYEIKTLYDSYPAIDIINPGKNVSLSNDNRLPLFMKISDDYGFSKLIINYRLSSSKYESAWDEFKSIEIPVSKQQKEADVNYIWNLSPVNLTVDDVVTYYAEIFDNDNVSGPKSTKTSEYTIRVPSLDEILARAENTQGEVQKDIQEVLKEAEDLKKTLDKIDQDMKQDKKELTWEEKEKLEKALDRFEQLQEKMEQAGNELQQMQEELQQNDLLSQETLEKYMELQKLMEEMSSDEMKQAMEKLRQMMEQMDRKNTQQAMEQMKLDEERFKKSVERTLNLLKRLQVEQKMDELVKRTEELTKKQEELEKQTGEKDLNNPKDKNDISKKQDDISKDLDKLEKEMEKLAEKMSEIPDMPSEEMEKLMEEMEAQKNQELSEQAKQDVQKNQKQQAMKKQDQISQNMQQMNQKMQDMQESMMQMNQMQTFTDMMRLLDNILSLSKQQEELRTQSEQLDPNSSQFKDNMQKQDNVQRNLDRITSQIAELSQKTFAITPELGKALGDAKREMMKSLSAMQNRNKGETFNNQGEAMGSLNEAATLMKGSMESMMQGGGQGGMMSLMQQMGQMSQQQMNLNNLTQMLQQGQQGQLSPEQQGQLQRLSQQQELIRKSVEQLNKEARESGQSKSLPGSLENIAREMQEIIKDMNTQKLDDDLVQKQEKILSRMLDIQKSINERDFEKKRESNTGENIVLESPADLNLSNETGKNKIKDELNRAVKEGYSKDYENLIRKYYEMLQEKKN
jgi:hypothetical protein